MRTRAVTLFFPIVSLTIGYATAHVHTLALLLKLRMCFASKNIVGACQLWYTNTWSLIYTAPFYCTHLHRLSCIFFHCFYYDHFTFLLVHHFINFSPIVHHLMQSIYITAFLHMYIYMPFINIKVMNVCAHLHDLHTVATNLFWNKDSFFPQ